MQNDAISRSAAIEEIEEWSYDDNELDDERKRGYNQGLSRAIRRVRNVPGLDVAPVVHARWIRDDLGNSRCSNCHTRLPFHHCYDEEDGYEWDSEIDETPWCMHCGARMDGEAE